jgi:hypothetical protein
MGDKNNHTVVDDGNNHTVVDDGTTVRGGDGTPTFNTPPSQKHAHHQGPFSVRPSTFAENGLTNGLCCVADGHVDASANIRDGMVAVGVCMVFGSWLGRS